MDKIELKSRTKSFSVRILKMVDTMPKTAAGYELTKQIVRSACSVGSNYRAACRAKSKVDFNYKINIVLEEADETLFWLEVMVEAEIMKESKLKLLMQEAEELVKIFSATLKSSRENDNKNSKKI